MDGAYDSLDLYTTDLQIVFKSLILTHMLIRDGYKDSGRIKTLQP